RSEHSKFSQQIQAADERVAKLEKELAAVRAELSETQTQQAEIETARAESLNLESQASEKLSELRLALATEQQRYDNLVAQRDPMSAREEELAETIDTRRAEIADFETRVDGKAGETKYKASPR